MVGWQVRVESGISCSTFHDAERQASGTAPQTLEPAANGLISETVHTPGRTVMETLLPADAPAGAPGEAARGCP
jgi:hypothetical protein